MTPRCSPGWKLWRTAGACLPAELPETDPTKIHFRFQVVDQKTLHDALDLPNGIILVPFQVVARLATDTQLAAVLADNIATVLEKQAVRMVPAGETMTAAQAAGLVGGFFVPGLGLATLGGNCLAAAKIRKSEEEQSGRVSLQLLHDAGFAPAEAPMTWWLLASLKPRDVANIPMPYRAQYLYGVLASTWVSPAEMTSPVEGEGAGAVTAQVH